MKYVVSAAAALALSVGAAPALAAGTPCGEVVAKIAEKLDAKGVVGYSLTPVPKDQEVTDGKQVGVCEAGTMKIIYVRGGSAPAPAPAAAAEAPPAQ
ncbi:MAG: DUF1161 domain-containing protein [Pseudomonadota bacterium]